MDFVSQKRRDQAVMALGQAIDRALDEFAEENEALIRSACQVSDDIARVRTPAVLSFLGHTLWRVYQHAGSTATQDIVTNLLTGFAEVEPENAAGPTGGARADLPGGQLDS